MVVTRPSSLGILQAVLRRKALDRAATNALLRQLFTGIVVNYTGKTKVLLLSWRQGGESTVVYGMDRQQQTLRPVSRGSPHRMPQ